MRRKGRRRGKRAVRASGGGWGRGRCMRRYVAHWAVDVSSISMTSDRLTPLLPRPPTPPATQGLWATGTARVVTPVLKGRRKHSPTFTSTTTTIRAPSRAVVLLRLPAPTTHHISSSTTTTTIAVGLQGERCLRCQPALRPGRRYHFPLLRPADPAGNEDDRLDYWGDGNNHGNVNGSAPPPVFVAVLPPVEMDMGQGVEGGGEDFAARPGLFAYPDHRPHDAVGGAAGGRETEGCCLQARVLHFEGVVRGVYVLVMLVSS